MTEVVNAVVEAADVDLGKGALLMALRCPDGEVRRISVRMQDDPEDTIPNAVGARFLTQVQGRAVRLKLDGDTVQDVGHFIEDRWLVGDRPQEPTEAEQCEKDRRNEP